MATTAGMDMKKALKQAALLRNRIETCLQASAAPMTGRELAEHAGILEIVGTSLSGYGKLSTQLKNMLKTGVIEKMGGGATTSYVWIGHTPEATPEPVPPQDLHLRIDKAAKTIGFTFNGLSITIEVV